MKTLISLSQDLVVEMVVFLSIIAISILVNILIVRKRAARKKILLDSLKFMNINIVELNKLFEEINEEVRVKSRQTLEKYDIKYFFKENKNRVKMIKDFILRKKEICCIFESFLNNNPFKNEKEYKYVSKQLYKYLNRGKKYVVKIKYITYAGNYLDDKILVFTEDRIQRIENTPELYMTKTEIKEYEKNKLEEKKKQAYSRVNNIIDIANELKDNLIIKREEKKLDYLIENLFDRTVNSIQKIKTINSEEWDFIEKFINKTESDIFKIKNNNEKIQNYYQSDDFKKIKETCKLLMQSQKDFNEYIEEKIKNISKMFGTRVSRTETEHADTYNYVRTYKKTISPFTAELSSRVFASAENNAIQYVIKSFYPNRALYKEQICSLKNLLNEIDALKDAKVIIDNYKKEYDKYIENVPKYVLEEDEDGFYSRLGFVIIDENVLNVEYRFVYTSDGGKAQRSFTVPMNEETITELINQLQSKLSSDALAKEQRALMTSKLRLAIKERDNYTCCNCGNSPRIEPNLLLEVDHIKPIAKGGLTIESNLQTLCWKCNRNKGVKFTN